MKGVICCYAAWVHAPHNSYTPPRPSSYPPALRTLDVTSPPPPFPWTLSSLAPQVVTCKPSKLSIPAHGKAELKVEYVPRKINSKYRKTVTIVNAFNPHGNVDVEIAASNTDTHHVLYHSHFYKVGGCVLAPSCSGEIYGVGGGGGNLAWWYGW